VVSILIMILEEVVKSLCYSERIRLQIVKQLCNSHRSLGVLLYTLVYGAMPFDGSNFKRLVKQISQGDYFEPKKPSRKFLYSLCSDENFVN